MWGNCGITLSNKIQKVQNSGIRVGTFSDFDADAKSLLENLGWNNLNQQRRFQKALMAFNSFNNLSPEYLCSFASACSTRLFLHISRMDNLKNYNVDLWQTDVRNYM